MLELVLLASPVRVLVGGIEPAQKDGSPSGSNGDLLDRDAP
jgi:hypothetical protein